MRSLKKRLLLSAIAVLAAMPGSSYAESREAILGRVQRYLESITTIKADFVQIAPGGELAGGSFMLKRPGKMRWQYDPPVPVVIVSTGSLLRYYDYELDQISDIPLDDTLAGFLARKEIGFDPDVVKVLEADARDGVLRVRIERTGKPGDGTLTMEFTETPLKLRNLILVDGEGKQTNISLNNARYGVKLPNSLFVIKDNRLSGKRR